MKKIAILISSFFVFLACQQKQIPVFFKKYDETSAIEKQQNHANGRMKFKLFQSKYTDMNAIFKPFENDLAYFSEQDYQKLKPLILSTYLKGWLRSSLKGLVILLTEKYL